MDETIIRNLIQFVLAAAGQEDWGNRELSSIHIVKYIYLGDLAYANLHKGKTFSGCPWKFHHYGPWCPALYQQIRPAIMAIDATERRFPSSYFDDDVVRWRIDDNDDLFFGLLKTIPREIATAIRRAIHEYGCDTQGLLHHVYNTPPMLQAAPGEYLSFDEMPELPSYVSAVSAEKPTLSKKEKKERKQKIDDLKQRIQDRLTNKQLKPLVGAEPPPRYDTAFEQGYQWLESLAGDPIEPDEGTINIADSLWKSPARSDRDIP
jgi:hypothetical protein